MTVESMEGEEDSFGLFKFRLFGKVEVHFDVVIVDPCVVVLILCFEDFRLALHGDKLEKFFAILTAFLVGDFFIMLSV